MYEHMECEYEREYVFARVHIVQWLCGTTTHFVVIDSTVD